MRRLVACLAFGSVAVHAKRVWCHMKLWMGFFQLVGGLACCLGCRYIDCKVSCLVGLHTCWPGFVSLLVASRYAYFCYCYLACARPLAASLCAFVAVVRTAYSTGSWYSSPPLLLVLVWLFRSYAYFIDRFFSCLFYLICSSPSYFIFSCLFYLIYACLFYRFFHSCSMLVWFLHARFFVVFHSCSIWFFHARFTDFCTPPVRMICACIFNTS